MKYINMAKTSVDQTLKKKTFGLHLMRTEIY